MLRLEPVTATAPSAWASYLINSDDSGLDDKEILAIQQWLAHIGCGNPVSCDDAGFIHHHNARQFWPFSADCQRYVFLPPSSPTGGAL